MLPVVSLDQFRHRLILLEEWLWCEGASKLGLARAEPTPQRVAARVEALSDLYTTGRDTMLGAIDDPAHLVAKVMYFLISDAPKVFLILRELYERYGSKPYDLLRVVDVGAGVGATSAGLLLSLDPAKVQAVRLHGFDADERALRMWKVIVREVAKLAGVALESESQVTDLTQSSEVSTTRSFDLCLAQAVVNELPFAAAEADRLRTDWILNWATRGTTIVIEPALRETTRKLHAARDSILADGRAVVLAPCLHLERCPMLAAGDRDWCHEMRQWNPTPRVAKVQALTRRRDERTKYSFIVAAPRQHSPPLHPWNELSGRLVSDALNSKGKMERTLCDSRGRLVPLRLLDRDRTPNNELLATAERGTLIQINNTSMPRVSREARVTPVIRG